MKTIFNSKWTKFIKLLVIGILLTFASVFCATDPDAPISTKIAGWVGIFFFGIGGMYAIVRDLRKILKGESYVQILTDGLLIYKTLIRWKNIVGFSKCNGGVLVFTNNVEERLAEATIIKKMNIKFSLWISKTDILAPELGFEGTCNDFIAQCQDAIRKFETKKQ